MTVTLDFHESRAWSKTSVSSSCVEFYENASNGLVVDTRSQTGRHTGRQTGRQAGVRTVVVFTYAAPFLVVIRSYTET